MRSAGEDAVKLYDREHVAPFLYTNPQRFVVNKLEIPEKYFLPHARVTLDTEEDYKRLQRIFSEIYKGGLILPEELQKWLIKETAVLPQGRKI